MKKTLLKCTGLAGAVAAISLGFAAVGASPAQAAGGWQRFDTLAECRVVQSNYARYYTILVPCKYFASSGYYFQWTDGK